METIIIISVLSTLGVVALVTAIVVAFRMLSQKVDVTDYNSTISEVSMSAEIERQNIRKDMGDDINALHNRIDKLETIIEHQFSDSYRQMNKADEDLNSLIDSRCDKLDTKIQNLQGQIDHNIKY